MVFDGKGGGSSGTGAVPKKPGLEVTLHAMFTQDESRIFQLNSAKKTQVEVRELYIKVF